MSKKIIEIGGNPTSVINANLVKLAYGENGAGKKHYVLWSGGTDSTLLLYELIATYGVENVIAISFIYPWLDGRKVENEAMHRKAIKEKIKLELSLDEDINHMEFTISQNHISGCQTNVSSGGLPQAVAWLSTIGLYAVNGSYVYCGAIKNDDLTVFMEPYHKMFEGMVGTLNRDITLREPYIMCEKYQILDKLFQYNMYDVTWYCEMPDGLHKPCMKCIPCVTHYAALVTLSMYGSSDLIKAMAKRELDKKTAKLEEINNPTPEKITLDKDECTN